MNIAYKVRQIKALSLCPIKVAVICKNKSFPYKFTRPFTSLIQLFTFVGILKVAKPEITNGKSQGTCTINWQLLQEVRLINLNCLTGLPTPMATPPQPHVCQLSLSIRGRSSWPCLRTHSPMHCLLPLLVVHAPGSFILCPVRCHRH